MITTTIVDTTTIPGSAATPEASPIAPPEQQLTMQAADPPTAATTAATPTTPTSTHRSPSSTDRVAPRPTTEETTIRTDTTGKTAIPTAYTPEPSNHTTQAPHQRTRADTAQPPIATVAGTVTTYTPPKTVALATTASVEEADAEIAAPGNPASPHQTVSDTHYNKTPLPDTSTISTEPSEYEPHIAATDITATDTTTDDRTPNYATGAPTLATTTAEPVPEPAVNTEDVTHPTIQTSDHYNNQANRQIDIPATDQATRPSVDNQNHQ